MTIETNNIRLDDLKRFIGTIGIEGETMQELVVRFDLSDHTEYAEAVYNRLLNLGGADECNVSIIDTLNKPNPNKPVFQMFPEALEKIQDGRCPTCNKIVNTGKELIKKHDPNDISSPFRDMLSRKEYSISGLCQDCQDEVFGVD